MIRMAPNGYVTGTSQLVQVQTTPTKHVYCKLHDKKRHYDVIFGKVSDQLKVTII